MVPVDELNEYPRKPGWQRLIVPAAIGVALAVILFLLLQPIDEAEEPKQLGSFELPLLDGGTLTDEDLRGRPVVVNFFASWCTPCREEARVLEGGFKKYESEGVQFIGVNVRDTPEDANGFVKEFAVSYPVVKDYEEILGRRLGTGLALPQTFFVTGDLEVLASEAGDEVGSRNGITTLGAIEPGELEAGIEELLEAG